MMCPKSPAAPRPGGPGRPKDLAKRAAILEAAKSMFVEHGFQGVSMDEIATAAGVSKLTVYSHFGDKEALFAEAVKSHCERGLPPALFEPAPGVPLRERLLAIGTAFYAMASSPEAVAGYRVLCTPQLACTPLSQLFWDAGPRRIQQGLAAVLARRVAAGELEIDDVERAAGQLLALFKGEAHALLVFGCRAAGDHDAAAHIAAGVDMFLRAYGTARRESR